MDAVTAKATVCEFHYTKSWPSGKTVVFCYEDAIVAFSIPANCNVASWLGCKKNRVWELTRLWAPDGHRKNLLTEAISFGMGRLRQMDVADAVVSYADPNAGHSGGVYRAASWTYLGQSEETRAYRDRHGKIFPRRKFHSGRDGLTKAQIVSKGFVELKLPGKHRFARGLNRRGKAAVRKKAEAL